MKRTNASGLVEMRWTEVQNNTSVDGVTLLNGRLTQKKIAEFVSSKYLRILCQSKVNNYKNANSGNVKWLHCFDCGLSICHCWKIASPKIAANRLHSWRETKTQWKGKWYSSTQSIIVIYQCTWKQEISKTNIAMYSNTFSISSNFCWLHSRKFFAFVNKHCNRTNQVSNVTHICTAHAVLLGSKIISNQNVMSKMLRMGKFRAKKIVWKKKWMKWDKRCVTFLD